MRLGRWKEKLGYSVAGVFFAQEIRNPLKQYSFKSCGVIKDLPEILSSHRRTWQAVNLERRGDFFYQSLI